MDLLLVLEHHFYKDQNNKYWCRRVINREFIERYLEIFEDITIFARVDDINAKEAEKNNYNKISGNNTNFLELPDFRGIKSLILNLVKIISKFKYNYNNYNCIMFRAPSPLSLLLYRFVRNNKIIGVEFVMGADNFFAKKGIINKSLNKFIDNEAKNLCLKANGVSYVTSNYLQQKYPSYSIKYSEDDKHFDCHYSSVKLEDYNYVKKDWNKNDIPKEFKIIHIGYMDSNRKGHKILIKSIKNVIQQGYSIKAIFIGDGKMKEEFIELADNLNIKNKINFFGATNNKKLIVDFLKKSHLFVLPSKSEGLPRVIIEAMAASTPCIASNADGIPELVDDEFIIESNLPKDYANKIIELINNWPKMIEVSRSNYKKSLEFHKDKLKNKRNSFYKKLKQIK